MSERTNFENGSPQALDGATRDFVTLTVADQLFGLPVLTVQDVLGPQMITRIPLAPPVVAGALNLRGRIVTALDGRLSLGLPPRSLDDPGMSIVVETRGELYSLLIDSVGEVLSIPVDNFECNPPTMDSRWRDLTVGVYRREGQLMIELDVDRLLDIDCVLAA